MSLKLRYDSLVPRCFPLALLFVGLTLAPALQAQNQGTHNSTSAGSTRASVPTLAIHPNSGVRLSMNPTWINPAQGTWINPTQGNWINPTQGNWINPLFPNNPNPPFFNHEHHGHHRFDVFGGVALPVYTLPYYYPYYPLDIVGVTDDTMEQNYAPGPTIFDRRGTDRSSVDYEQQYQERLNRLQSELDEIEAKSHTAAPAQPTADQPGSDQPATMLVFRDGHSLEVTNYAIVGDTLYDFSSGARRKITLADLDLPATQKQNEDRGVDFRLPASRPSGN